MAVTTNPMVPSPSDPTSYSIPHDLIDAVPDRLSPWKLSSGVFERARASTSPSLSSKMVEVRPGDPEWAFVLKAFAHSPPPGTIIAKVEAIHNPSLTQAFEAYLPLCSQESRSFPPEWDKDGQVEQRRAVIERFDAMAQQFQPVMTQNATGRTDPQPGVAILPLWHGTRHADSVAQNGFTFFGKHSFFSPHAKIGSAASTDPGYFGSGIYLTTSPHYAQMYGAGQAVLAWVAMREPFPVVNDKPHPLRGSDMQMLSKGLGGYQKYDAHYIPVTLARPDQPWSMEYHPCLPGEKPRWDEVAVFAKEHCLPRFIVTFAPEGATIPPSIESPIVTKFEAQPGLNLVATCRNSSCSDYGNNIIINKGFGEFDVVGEAGGVFCPTCNDPLPLEDVRKVVFKGCSFQSQELGDGAERRTRDKSVASDETVEVVLDDQAVFKVTVNH